MLSKRATVLSSYLAIFLGFPLASCTDEADPADGGGSSSASLCGTCVEPTAIDLTTPTVSFTTDIFEGILRPSCNASTCHGAPTGRDPNGNYPAAQLYLGATSDNLYEVTIDAALMTTVIGNLKADSKTTPGTKIVNPGSPETSFVVAKIYRCQNERGLTCKEQSGKLPLHCSTSACGDPMPPLDKAGQIVQLSEEQKNTFRRWIAQGAQDN